MSTNTDAKVALVTGAAMGIGAAIAEQLARDGMIVLVSDLDQAQANKTATRFRDWGMAAEAVALDVSNSEFDCDGLRTGEGAPRPL